MASRPFFEDPPPALPAAIPMPPRIRDGGAAPLRLARLLVRGREEDAAWVRPSLIGLLGIAARLYLSPRTIQTHVSHVMGKLGVASRSAIAAEASRRQRG